MKAELSSEKEGRVYDNVNSPQAQKIRDDLSEQLKAGLEKDAARQASEDPAGVAGNEPSFAPSLSADARFNAFTSLATNLAPVGQGLHASLFVHDNFGAYPVTARAGETVTGLDLGSHRGRATGRGCGGTWDPAARWRAGR